MSHGVLYRLRDRHAQAARAFRVVLQDFFAVLRPVARAWYALGAPGLHHYAPVRLLVVARPHHVDRALHAEQARGERERASPLAGARLRCEAGHSLLHVVVSLGDGGVGLVASGRAVALPLVINFSWSLQELFEPGGAVQRRGAPDAVDVAHLFRYRNPALLADLLLDQLHRKKCL